jgi:hypothetical protein
MLRVGNEPNDSSVQAGEDSWCLRQRVHCDRPLSELLSTLSVSYPQEGSTFYLIELVTRRRSTT